LSREIITALLLENRKLETHSKTARENPRRLQSLTDLKAD
jgi:hypothetical protein